MNNRLSTYRTLFWCLLVTATSLGLAVSSALAASDEHAHTMLTDGQRAEPNADDPEWLRLLADSTQLPKAHYAPGEFAFWGVNMPTYLSPGRNPVQLQWLKDANILGVRYALLWGGLQQQGPFDTNFDWFSTDWEVQTLSDQGFSVILTLDYTPAWANGHRKRMYPPSKSVDNELLNLSTGSAVLQHIPIIMTEPDEMPVVVTPENVTTTLHEDEVVDPNFSRTHVPRCSKWPVVVGTEQVWVDENDGRGWVLWQRVANLLYSPDGAEHYMFDRAGRIRFRDNAFYYYHGKTPADGSKVKITYETPDVVYKSEVDYHLDSLTGVLTRYSSGVSDAIPVEEFTSSPLDPDWMWLNEPSQWDVNQTSSGHLYYKIDAGNETPGHFLYHTLSGSGDFSLSLRVTTAATTGDSQTGIQVYQDADNWFRYGISSDAGRPLLTQCIDGVVTVLGRNGELGFQIGPPRWITVRKSGNGWVAFTSSSNPAYPDGGYQFQYNFFQTLTYPMNVGVASAGVDANGVTVDKILVDVPVGGQASKVNVSYTYLDPQPMVDFAVECVNHFKDRVKYWELYNEPDQAWTWRGGQQVYALLLKAVADAIHQADPEAKVMNGGYANEATPNLNFIYNTIPKSAFDYVAWHPYLFSAKAPDAFNWGTSFTNLTGRSIMLQNDDADKKVFFGELATASGVQAEGGGMNDRKQAEYATRMFLWSRRIGYVKGIQWWPGIDLYFVGQNEWHRNGGHEGLFYGWTGQPKPVYWHMRNAASNKGFLMDLVTYDQLSQPVPASRKYALKSVKVGVLDRAKVAGIKVFASLSGSDDQCIPLEIAARPIGQSQAGPFKVYQQPASSGLKNETWTVSHLSAGVLFSVTGSLSGPQGTAQVEQEFTAANGAVKFTIPTAPKPYISGDYFTFETYKGDGYKQVAHWQNDFSAAGPGDIEVVLPNAEDARYISVHLIKTFGAPDIRVDEIQVFDAGGANISEGKLYIVDGYQEYFSVVSAVTNLGGIKNLPDGTQVDLADKALYLVKDGFGYVEEIDRSSGVRIEGTMEADEGDVVAITGTMGTTAGGERFIQINSITSTGTHLPAPFFMTNRSAIRPLSGGIFAKVSGTVLAGSIQPESYEISDASSAESIRVISDNAQSVSEGDYVVVEGALGYDNGRVIYEK